MGTAPGMVSNPSGLAADAVGNLYVAEGADGNNGIQKCDPDGNWSVIAGRGSEVGQVNAPLSLAVDKMGNLYVADALNSRVQEYTPIAGL
jgi:DNA-binding beta-propeller fold protein YncE